MSPPSDLFATKIMRKIFNKNGMPNSKVIWSAELVCFFFRSFSSFVRLCVCYSLIAVFIHLSSWGHRCLHGSARTNKRRLNSIKIENYLFLRFIPKPFYSSALCLRIPVQSITILLLLLLFFSSSFRCCYLYYCCCIAVGLLTCAAATHCSVASELLFLEFLLLSVTFFCVYSFLSIFLSVTHSQSGPSCPHIHKLYVAAAATLLCMCLYASCKCHRKQIVHSKRSSRSIL